MHRRTFLRSLAAAAVLPGLQVSPGRRKAVLISMLAKDLPYARRFALAREAGDKPRHRTRQDDASLLRRFVLPTLGGLEL